MGGLRRVVGSQDATEQRCAPASRRLNGSPEWDGSRTPSRECLLRFESCSCVPCLRCAPIAWVRRESSLPPFSFLVPSSFLRLEGVRSGDGLTVFARGISRWDRPAAPQRPVERHQRGQPSETLLCERVLGGQKLLLSVEYFDVARKAADIPDVGELDRLLIGGDGTGLFLLRRGELLISGERGRDLAEGPCDDRLVLNLRLLKYRHLGVVLVLEAAALKKRARESRRDRPGLPSGEEVGDLRADAPKSTGQTDLGKELRLGGADLSVGGNEV